MNTFTSPWDLAYIKFKDHYSRDEIDNMLWCEIEELLANEETDEK